MVFSSGQSEYFFSNLVCGKFVGSFPVELTGIPGNLGWLSVDHNKSGQFKLSFSNALNYHGVAVQSYSFLINCIKLQGS